MSSGCLVEQSYALADQVPQINRHIEQKNKEPSFDHVLRVPVTDIALGQSRPHPGILAITVF